MSARGADAGSTFKPGDGCELCSDAGAAPGGVCALRRTRLASRDSDTANAAGISLAHLFGALTPDPATVDPARLPRSAGAFVLRGTLIPSAQPGLAFGRLRCSDTE